MNQRLKNALGERGLQRIRIVRRAIADLRASFQPPPAAGHPIDIAEIRARLEEFGVRKGDILHVHTSVSHLMRGASQPPRQPLGLRTYAKALLQMLQELVGEQGTLTMGTDFERPEGWLRRLAAGVPLAADTFDPASSPSIRGLVSEYFRKLPGARRSVHPYYNLTARGPLADVLVGEHHRSTPYAQDRFSPWSKLTDRGAKVALLGRTFEVNSLVHLVEYLHPAEFPRPLFVRPVVMPYRDHAGTPQSLEVALHSWGVPGSQIFNPFALYRFAAYINEHHGPVYRTQQYAPDVAIAVYDAQAQYRAFEHEMRRNVTWYDPRFQP